MKTWQETERVFRRLGELAVEGGKAVLASVITIKGSTYRGPGARVLIEADGRMTGNISGGCLEQDVRCVAERVLKSGKPEKLHYETGSDEDVVWGMGMGCDGELDLFLQVLPGPVDANGVQALCEALASDQPCVMSTVLEHESAAGRLTVICGGRITGGGTGDEEADKAVLAQAVELSAERDSALHEAGGCRLFTERLHPPPKLVVCGAGDDAVPLVEIASRIGFRVTVVDHRAAYLSDDRFPDAFALVKARAEDAVTLPEDGQTYVVVKTRVVTHDEAWVRRYLSTGVPYVGLLGPRARREKMIVAADAGDNDRVFGPVGLDLDADGPVQIALSIVAEIMAVAAGRGPGHLRERDRPIHG